MKVVAPVVVALGLLLAMAAPSLAHDHWGGHDGYHHHPVYAAPYYYGPYRPVVVVPAPSPVVVAPPPAYPYVTPAPVVVPACPTVVPRPYIAPH